ncbi:MAG: YcbK family protein [Bradymonadia bacterium]
MRRASNIVIPTRREVLMLGGLMATGCAGRQGRSAAGPDGGFRDADDESDLGPLAAEDRPEPLGRKKLEAINAGYIHVRHVNTREEASIRLLEPDMDAVDGWVVRPEGRTQMAHFLRDWRKGVEKIPPDRLLHHLHALARHFEARIHIISGHRSTTRKSSRHYQGKAIDLRVDGVDHKEVWSVLRTLPKVGSGYYPNARFVHLDVRKRSYSWIDDSGPGEKSRYRKGVPQPPRAVDKQPLPG